MLPIFTTTFRVRGYELRKDGAIGHAVFMHWFEEAAIQASMSAGYGLEKYNEIGAAWVMHDVDVEFLVSARYGEEVRVSTWVSDFRRIRSHREYEARRPGDNALLARARVEWIFLDTRTMMPRRLSPEMVATFSTNAVPALSPREWPDPESAEAIGRYESTRRVQHYEIDQMQHVNNVVYLNWVEQQACEAWQSWGREPGELHLSRHFIEYRQAAQEGDQLALASVAARFDDSVIWRHKITRGDALLVDAYSLG